MLDEVDELTECCEMLDLGGLTSAEETRLRRRIEELGGRRPPPPAPPPDEGDRDDGEREEPPSRRELWWRLAELNAAIEKGATGDERPTLVRERDRIWRLLG